MVTEQEILALADTMAASASDMNSMTYDTLMNSRQELQTKVHEIFEKVERYRISLGD